MLFSKYLPQKTVTRADGTAGAKLHRKTHFLHRTGMGAVRMRWGKLLVGKVPFLVFYAMATFRSLNQVLTGVMDTGEE